MAIKQDHRNAGIQSGQNLMAVGGLLGALAASSCCILPLVLFSLGVSGAWIGNFTQLAPYQPYFIAATIACLGYGYWLVYRPAKIACAGGEACARPLSRAGSSSSGSSWQPCSSRSPSALISWRPFSSTHERRIPMTKFLAPLAFALGLLASSAAFAGEKTITLAVQNMYCAACPHTVKSSLEAVPGVVKATVSYQEQTAVVTYDDTKADVSALTTATTKAGYPSAPKS
jgi:mercuric ion transport protein